MSDTRSTDVAETVTSSSQPGPVIEPRPMAVPLDKVIASIATDSLKNAKEYLKATTTPGGGE